MVMLIRSAGRDRFYSNFGMIFSGSKLLKFNSLPKKAINRTLTVLAVLIVVLAGLFISLRMRSVQTWLVNRFLTNIEERYDGRLSVGKVLVRWPHRIELVDLLILDPVNDTLFYASSVRLSVKKYNIDKNRLSLSRVVVEDPKIQLRQLPSGLMNYEVLLESFKSSDTVKSTKPLSVAADQIFVRRGSLQYRKFGTLEKPGQVDPDNLLVTGLEAALRRFAMQGDETRAVIDHISFQEQSGFLVNQFSAAIRVGKKGVFTENLELLTGNSHVGALRANVTGIFGSGAGNHGPEMDIVLDTKTYVSPIDLTLLTGISTGLTDPIEIAGVFNGSPDNGRLMNAMVNWPGLVAFEGDLVYNYPGRLQEAFFDLKTRYLELNMPSLSEDVLAGQIPGFELDVPDAVKKIGTVTYRGVFTGTFENFITTGNWSFDYGDFTTNLEVNKNRPVAGYNFKGSVSASDFNPDQLMTQPSGFSGMEFNLNVDGVWDGAKSVNALLAGEVSQFTLNGYTFQYLNISGRATGSRFNGKINLRDPNANLDLDGNFDFSKDTPAVDFDLLVKKADLYALNLIKSDTLARLQLDLHGSFTGSAIDEMDGEIRIRNSSYTNSRGTLPVTDMSLTSVPELGKRKIIFSSEYVDARIVGNVHIDDLAPQARSLIAKFVPAVTGNLPVRQDHMNSFAFNVQIKNSGPVTKVLLPGFQCKDNTRVGGFYDAAEQAFSLEGTSPQFVVMGRQFTGLDFRIMSRGDSVLLSGDLGKLQIDRSTLFEKINLGGYLSGNLADMKLRWNENGQSGSRGSIACVGGMAQREDGSLTGSFLFPESRIVLNDSLWTINRFAVSADKDKISIENFALAHNEEKMEVNGSVSRNPSDTLYIDLQRVNLLNFKRITGKDFVLDGRITGSARIFDIRNRLRFLTEMRIDSLAINGQPMGQTTLSSRSSENGDALLMDVLVKRGAIKTLQLQGQYNPVTDSLNLDLSVEKLRLDIANPFVYDELLDVKGLATGKVMIRGSSKKPLIYGHIMAQKASFIVNYLNTRFYFTHNVVITPDAFSVTNLDLQDDEGNHASVNGAVRHTDFNKIRLDLKVDFKDFVLLNEVESRNEGYWGRGYASGVGTLTGPLRSLKIDVSARTSPKTKFYIPVTTTDEARFMDFVTYIGKPKEETEADLLDFSAEVEPDYAVNLYGAMVTIDLEATPDAEVQLIFDSKVGNVIHARGSGNLRVEIPPTSRWTLNGDFTIEKGDYQFTLQNMPVKKLEIEPGATLKWTGDVSGAQLNIDAVYRTKAALYDLLQDESNPDLTQRLPVECHLMMSGQLEAPAIDFNIILPPTSNDLARTQLQNLTKEDMNKQVISLLILNRFTPLAGTGSGTASRYESAGLATTTELLSNQLNYWLSQISKDFDVGFNYRPGDQLTSDEVEVALSKQFLDNRMTINVNGNVDVRPSATNANQLVGDVEIEYKIKQSGKVRVKAFTRANDHLLYEYAPYTQGVGLFYREEFDTFGDLVQKYRNKRKRN
jgi:hypothetical protein